MSRPESTERRFLRSSLASYLSLGTRLVINLVYRMALARLVIPEGHGLYEEALVVVTVAAAFRDLGLVHNLIRDPHRAYGTVLAFTLGSGLVLTAALVLGAPAFSLLNSDLPPVLRVFAVWVLLDGLMVVPKTYFERELKIGALLVPEILRGLTVAAVSIILAVQGWEVWSFVWGELAAAALFAVLVWRRAWGKIPLEVDRKLLPELLLRSRFLLFIWLTAQLVAKVDVVIIELATSDTGLVGFYTRAYWIPMLVPMIFAPRALLPALVEYREDAARFFSAFRFGVVFLLSFQVMAGYFLFFNAHKVIAILLGPGWGPAVPLLQILCFVPFVDISAALGGEVLKVRHEDRVWLLTMVLNLVSLVGFGTWFTLRWGAEGMAFANFLAAGNALMAWRLWAIFGRRFRRLLVDLAWVYLAPLPFFLGAGLLFGADTWSRFALSMVAAALSTALLAGRFYRPFAEFFRGRQPDEE